MIIENKNLQNSEDLIEPKKQPEEAGDSFEDLMNSLNEGDDDSEGLLFKDDNSEITEEGASIEVGSKLVESETDSELSISMESIVSTETIDKESGSEITRINADESIVETDPEYAQLNERIGKLLKESSTTNTALLNSIAQARAVIEGFAKEKQQLGDSIEGKRLRSRMLKEEISAIEKSSSVVIEEAGSSDEFGSRTEIAMAANCESIVTHVQAVQKKLADNGLVGWRGDVERIEGETKLFKMRMQYIELLKEIDRDYSAFQSLHQEERECSLRFQNCRSFF